MLLSFWWYAITLIHPFVCAARADLTLHKQPAPNTCKARRLSKPFSLFLFVPSLHLFVRLSFFLIIQSHSLLLVSAQPSLPVSLASPPPSAPSRWPLPVLFDINIMGCLPDGVGFRCGAVAISALLLPCYKQVSGGPRCPITVGHMLIEEIRQPWIFFFWPCLPACFTLYSMLALLETGSKNIDISLILEFKACCS